MLSTIKAYAFIAFVIGGISLLGLIYAKGVLDARHAAQLRDLQEQVKQLNADVERWRKAYELDAAQARADAIQEKIAVDDAVEIETNVQEPNRPAIDAATADRLRQFSRGQHKATPASPTKRP